MPKRKRVTIKNFDEDLYRLIKVYASLEGKTVAAVIEEAVRSWLSGKSNYGEVLEWARLEEEYRRNYDVLKRELEALQSRYGEGYVLICNGRVIGVFSSYLEAARKSLEACSTQALIVKLPYEKRVKKVELGLPW